MDECNFTVQCLTQCPIVDDTGPHNRFTCECNKLHGTGTKPLPTALRVRYAFVVIQTPRTHESYVIVVLGCRCYQAVRCNVCIVISKEQQVGVFIKRVQAGTKNLGSYVLKRIGYCAGKGVRYINARIAYDEINIHVKVL